MTKSEIIKSYQDHILSTYTRTEAVFVKGKGMDLYDIHGKKYLDFFPGWGVNNVGHCHPKVMAAVRDQIGKLIHIPNNFYHPNQAKLASEIIRHSFPGKVFFCNSGAEGNEAAIKFARIFGGENRNEIITMSRSFHGRTLGALAATGQPAYQKGFAPLPGGFTTVPFNDMDAVRNAYTEQTVAVLLEPVQGEGGVHVAEQEYMSELRTFCDQKNILLIFDEVQTGMGRTGQMFAFQNYDVVPDLMILAKALGGGLPIGALVVREELSGYFKPGMHASTFGGSPLVTKASLGVFRAIKQDKMLANCREMGTYLLERMTQLKARYSRVRDVRGMGLMIGVELDTEGASVVRDCFQEGLIINCTQGRVLRLMPALNVTKKQIDKAVLIIDKAIAKIP